MKKCNCIKRNGRYIYGHGTHCAAKKKRRGVVFECKIHCIDYRIACEDCQECWANFMLTTENMINYTNDLRIGYVNKKCDKFHSYGMEHTKCTKCGKDLYRY